MNIFALLLCFSVHLASLWAATSRFPSAFYGSRVEKLVENEEVVSAVELQDEEPGTLKRQVLSGEEKVSHKRISIHFHAFKKDFDIDLVFNDNIFPLDGYNSSNAYAKEFPGKKCFYQGKVRAVKESNVAVSVCGGVTGILELGKTSYFLEPAEKGNSDSPLKHVIYTLKDAHGLFKSKFFRFDKHHPKRHNHLSYFQSKQTRFVHLQATLDTSLSKVFEGDNERAMLFTGLTVNIVDSWFKALNVRLILKGLEIWKQRDKITLESTSSGLLKNVLKYKREKVDPHSQAESLQFLTTLPMDGGATLGRSTQASICVPFLSASVISDPFTHPSLTATIMTHQLGHSLGLKHDHHNCACAGPSRHCVMSKAFHLGVKEFSDCSKAMFSKLAKKGLLDCLSSGHHGNKVCGNGVVEEGEVCDCGGVEECERKNPCCDHKTCKLKSSSSCAAGACCVDCRFASSATPCRNSKNECDVAEYCTGHNQHCPKDTWVPNDRACDDDKGYCYKGTCRSHDQQCQSIYGDQAQVADAQCYKESNARGSETGNCGKSEAGFVKCSDEDSLCGALQCDISLLERDKNGTMKVEKIQCLSTQFHRHSTALMTREGTKCAPGKQCRKQKCVPLKSTRGCSVHCHDHGTCNPKNNTCNCDPGWLPPHCEFTAGTAAGAMHLARVLEDNRAQPAGEAQTQKQIFSPDSPFFKPVMISGGCLILLLLIALVLFIKYRVETARKNAILAKRILVQYHSASSELGNINSLISNKQLFTDVTSTD